MTSAVSIVPAVAVRVKTISKWQRVRNMRTNETGLVWRVYSGSECGKHLVEVCLMNGDRWPWCDCEVVEAV